MDAALRLVATRAAPRELSRRLRKWPPYVRPGDPAVGVMTDYTHEVARTIGGDQRLDEALNELFRSGASALLVRRDQQIIGLVAVGDLKGEYFTHPDCRVWRDSLCVADVMTNVSDMPTIDWLTVLDASVVDLVEIFQGAAVECLVVIESESRVPSRIRGLIYRSRLERQMGHYAASMPRMDSSYPKI
jgi:CBS domain-containing protein